MDIFGLKIMLKNDQLVALLQDEETQVCGMEMIVNVGKLTLNHVKHIEREYGRLMMSILQVSQK